jgi:SAM-dependent methyltransferase
VFLHPLPGPEAALAVTGHYETQDPHSAVARSKEAFFLHALQRLDSLCPHKERLLLDAGCGHGYFLEKAVRAGWKPFGLEPAPAAARGARERLPGAQIVEGVLGPDMFPGTRFDAVTLWDMLFLSLDPLSNLVCCQKALRPGGALGLRVRNSSFQQALKRVFSAADRIAPRRFGNNPSVFHVFSFTPRSLRFLLARAGFTEIRVENSPLTSGDPYMAARGSILARTAKHGADALARAAFVLSAGRAFMGPSLVVFAKKPLGQGE